jgi:hypothetical protein
VYTLSGGHISPILTAKAGGIRDVDIRDEATAGAGIGDDADATN